MKNLITSIVWYAPAQKPQATYILEWIMFPIIAPFFTNLPLEHAKLGVLATVSFLVVLIVLIRVSKGIWKLEDLGFRPGNVRKYWPAYLIAVVLGTFWLWIFGYVNPKSWGNVNVETLALYSLVGAFLQEFLYRSYLIKLGEEIFGKRSALNFLFNVLLFTGMHYFFQNGWEKMGFVLPGAILFTWLYQKYPSFILIAIIHSVFNALSVLDGVFH